MNDDFFQNPGGSWRDEFKLKSDEDGPEVSFGTAGIQSGDVRKTKTFQLRFKVSVNELDSGSNERTHEVSTGDKEVVLSAHVSADDLKSKGVLPTIETLEKYLVERYLSDLKEEFAHKYYNTF